MAGKLVVDTVQLGSHATAANNFVIKTNLDGSFTIARGNDGATTQNIITVDAAGNVTMNVPSARIIGTTAADEAAAGYVGEYLSASRAFASPLALATGSTDVVCSLALTAGDWEVFGKVGLITAPTTVVTRLIAYANAFLGVQTYDVDRPGQAALVWNPGATLNTGGVGNPMIQIGRSRFNLSAPDTVELRVICNFTTAAASAFGEISARRIR